MTRTLKQVIQEYGKFGILIDDSAEANSRVARDLYGSERLPHWWLIAKSRNCARKVLEQLRAINQERTGDQRRTPGILVIDRLLPESCANSSKPMALDHLRHPVQVFLDLIDPAHTSLTILGAESPKPLEETRQLALLITSFPHGEPRAKERNPLPWQRRNLQVFARARSELRNAPPDRDAAVHALLSYGPERGRGPESDKAAGSRQSRGTLWKDGMLLLKERLSDERRSPILLLGAGASVPCAPLGAGMPRFEWLLRRTAQLYAQTTSREPIPDSHVGPPMQLPSCDCCEPRSGLHRWVEPTYETAEAESIPEFVNAVAAGTLLRAGKVEHLVSGDKDANTKEVRQRFLNAFRQVLHAHDHRFPYHSWLLSALPWRGVVTTNYDRFIERAAMTWAETSTTWGERRDYLHRATVLSEESEPAYAAQADPGPGGGPSPWVHKPFGSLERRSDVTVQSRDLDAAQPRIRISLQSLIRGGDDDVCLVVVGQAMRDVQVHDTLVELGFFQQDGRPGGRKGLAVWAVPEARDATSEVDKKVDGRERRGWANFMRRFAEEPPSDTMRPLPLPCHALDFAYDLYSTWRT